MRIVLSLILSVFHTDAFNARSPVSNIIRPHTRFLIQSVVEKRGGGESRQTCAASSALEGTLLGDHIVSLSKATSSTQSFLQSLLKGGKTDDTRRFADFHDAWKQTIVAEISSIKEAVGEKLKVVDASKKLVDNIIAMGRGEDPQRQVPLVKRKFAFTPEDHSLQGMKDGDDVLLSSLALSQEEWEKRSKSLEKSSGSLLTLSQALKDLQDAAGKVFDNLIKETEEKREDKDQPDLKQIGDTSTIMRLIGDVTVSQGSGDKRYAEFKTYITDQGGLTHAARLSKLTTALNILQMRRLGLEDAQKSSGGLVGKIQALANSQVELIIEKLGEIRKSLESDDTQGIPKYASLVYQEAQALSPDIVKIEESLTDADGEEHLDNHMKALGESVAQGALAEFPHHLNLVVNAMWRLHAHIAGFVETYDPSAVDDRAKVETSGSRLVNGFGDFVANLIANGKQVVTDRAQESVATDIDAMTKGARDGANCMLYGRIDSLLRNLKLIDDKENVVGEAKLCTKEFHDLSLVEMRKMGLSVALLKEDAEKFETELKAVQKTAREEREKAARDSNTGSLKPL